MNHKRKENDKLVAIVLFLLLLKTDKKERAKHLFLTNNY